MMGDTIWVESRAGEGSTFHFTASFGLRPTATDATADSTPEADGGAATKCETRLRILLAERVRELEEALSQVQQLQGLLPICSYCKSIRDDGNYWQQVESYIVRHSGVQFSHSICPTATGVSFSRRLTSCGASSKACTTWRAQKVLDKQPRRVIETLSPGQTT